MQNILPPDEIKAVMSETFLKYIEELEKQHAAHGELKVVKAVVLAATTSRTYIEWLNDDNMELEFNKKFEPFEDQPICRTTTN
jgi:response regulator of citrate/malate metabolism